MSSVSSSSSSSSSSVPSSQYRGGGCFPLDSVQVIDLSHPLNDQTIFWPGGEKFSLCMSISGSDANHDFYSAGQITCAEHGGTHIDAPYHFSEHGQTVDQLSIQSLMGHGRVIDVSQKCSAAASSSLHHAHGNSESDYAISQEDIEEYEQFCQEDLKEGEIILFRTGWAKQYYSLGSKAYLGFDERIDGSYDPQISQLRFPGIGVDAAKYLVSKKVAGVGLDTDPGSCGDFLAHRIILGAGIYGIENINAEIEHLPATGSTIMVMPLKLTGGSGSPSRVVAFVPTK